MKHLDGKVAFVTGAARGSGRAISVALAEAGAAVIALDVCRQIDSVFYDLASGDDLDETCELIRAAGSEVVAVRGDVRSMTDLQDAVAKGVAGFGRLDIVVPNAAILPVIGDRSDTFEAWQDCVDINLTGVWNTIRVSLPVLLEQGEGGSIVIINSTGGLKGLVTNLHAGSLAYVAAKHGTVGLMRAYATELGRHCIRVNSVHPTGVDTPMATNKEFGEYFAEHPSNLPHALPVALVEPADVSAAVVFLSSPTGRYITGVALPVDAGFTVI